MSSQEFVDEVLIEGGPGSCWIMTTEERSSIAKMLDLDDDNAAKMKAHNMSRDRMTCQTCGKRSGVDDIVHSAQALGVHSTEFMVDVLMNGPKGQNPSHAFDCSQCGTTFEGVADWRAYPPWVHGL
ncbi:hypothetical protein TWF481_004510 [Arthrobotrys musiformis]|uniref:C2H2-type domain-containing protein n=1 Tax=Arthrobotrys musiformis TaxID=47236 RepID=A0AAV9WKV7_9PEZI